jgi:hypothetical protein
MIPPLAALALLAQATPAASPHPSPTPSAQPALPPGTPEEQDERCLAAFAYLAGQGGDAAEAGKTGAMFFYGKLAGRHPGIDLAGAMRTAAARIAATIRPELLRCSGELQAAGQAMTAAGGALKN